MADLQSILKNLPGKRLNEIGGLCLMRQILQSLEYIHNLGYCHGDIKGSNLMLKSNHEAYLVDYGLAYRFMRDKIHSKYETKQDRRHNGTINYTSRDAHDGARNSNKKFFFPNLNILKKLFIYFYKK